MTGETLDQAIAQARAGREEGYRDLFVAFSPAVFALVRRILPDAADAEEVTQDTFLHAFRALSSYDAQRGSFATWLRRIAYNAALSRLRQTSPQTLSLSELGDGDAMNEADEAVDFAAEQIDALMTAIAALPAQEQVLLTLHYFDELPLTEVAYVVGSNAAAVASRLLRIRKKLKRMLI